MNNNEIDNIITLTDEEGNTQNFEFIDLINYLNKEYVVLIPYEEDEDEAGEVVILEVEDNNYCNEESYNSVEDMNILNAVFEIFKDKHKEDFNFVD